MSGHVPTSKYEQQNLETARIILEDPERYGGEPSALVRWARLVLERTPKKRIDWNLFSNEEDL